MGSSMLCDAVCVNTPVFSLPKVPEPLWHSRHNVNTNGPRLSTWHLRHGCSLSSAVVTSAPLVPVRQEGAKAPCGLWQSVHWITPSFTRCFTGISNCARIVAWHE